VILSPISAVLSRKRERFVIHALVRKRTDSIHLYRLVLPDLYSGIPAALTATSFFPPNHPVIQLALLFAASSGPTFERSCTNLNGLGLLPAKVWALS
jgi:hypothetical protein